MTRINLWSACTLLLVLGIYPASGQDHCGNQKTCSDCIASPDCGWCKDGNFREMFSNATTGRGPQFCGTVSDLMATGCRQSDIVDPRSQLRSNTSGTRVSPEIVTIDLRIDERFEQQVAITPESSFPIDMYVLMDLSLTMADDLETLRRISQKLIDTLSQLTNSNDFRLGFGSFVDKTVYPFSDQLNPDYPCGIGRSPDGTFVPQDECAATYDFKHHLGLTTDISSFQSAINNISISASFDHPEGLLDALLQASVCTETIGWRDANTARRLIVAITDDEYHYALDGKFAGIVSPSDGQCHLELNAESDFIYSEQANLDYPSSFQLGQVFQDNSIIPIFIVAASQNSLYTALADTLKGAYVGVIDGGLGNLERVIQDRYQELSTTVIPIRSNSLDSIDVMITPECGAIRPGSTDVCVNVTAINSARYTIAFQARQGACKSHPSGTATLEVAFVGFGKVTFNINLHCSCDAFCQSLDINSTECNGQGDLNCGKCLCNQDWYGGKCECQGNPPPPAALICKASDEATQLCSGQGVCDCGYCKCDKLPSDNTMRYEGEYCQCDRGACPRNAQNEICSNHGTCSACTGTCTCDSGYTNLICDCTTSNTSCIRNDDSLMRVCSGRGKCHCGQCLCTDYRVRTGKYCDICPRCIEACSHLGECVVCQAQGQSNCQDLCRNLSLVYNRTEVEESQEYVNDPLRRCLVESGSCQLPFFLDGLLLGTESGINVFVDSTDSAYQRIRSNGCGSTTEVWPIAVGLVLGIIFLGLLALIIWRVVVYWMDYREYHNFVKEQKNNQWNKSENPVYVSPHKDFHNPQYQKKQAPQAFEGTAL